MLQPTWAREWSQNIASRNPGDEGDGQKALQIKQGCIVRFSEGFEMAKAIQVKLVRSPIGRPEKQRKILQALGLTRLNKTVTLYGTPQVVGAIRKVVHMVEVSEG